MAVGAFNLEFKIPGFSKNNRALPILIQWNFALMN